MLLADAILAMSDRDIVKEEYFIATPIVAIVLVVIGFVRAFAYNKHMVRMTMGVYEACLENQNFKGV